MLMCFHLMDILWSDEARINEFGSDCVQHVWCGPGLDYYSDCVMLTVKHGGGSVLIKVASSGSISKLFRIRQLAFCLYNVSCNGKTKLLLLNSCKTGQWGTHHVLAT
uniref:Uncharacterized protein n=1 Tax=Monopterus albus TaxID=43700 RepID=A0A3Q3JX18_MONAL